MAHNSSVYEGAMPAREGEFSLEMHGMAPIPVDNRYGGLHRVFTVWFTPNLVPAAFFVGALAPVLGLGFGLGLAAILLGTILGSLLVAVMCSWGADRRRPAPAGAAAIRPDGGRSRPAYVAVDHRLGRH